MPPALFLFLKISSFVAPFCPTLCDPIDCSKARLPCPSLTPEAYSNSCPLSRWWHPTISSSVVPFSSCLQSFPASGSFPMSQFFTSGGQSIGALASVLPMNIQNWFPLEWIGWISLQSKGLSRVFSSAIVQKHQFFSAQLSLFVVFCGSLCILRFLYFCGKTPLNFGRDCTESTLDIKDILAILIIPICEHGISFYMFCMSLILFSQCFIVFCV